MPVTLVIGVTVLVAAASAIGVFAGRGTATVDVTGVRSNVYPMVSEGVYRDNSERAMAEGFVRDLLTLDLSQRSPSRTPSSAGRWAPVSWAVGLLAYVFYQYFMYSLAWVFGPLFLLFVATYAQRDVVVDEGAEHAQGRLQHLEPDRAGPHRCVVRRSERPVSRGDGFPPRHFHAA